MGVLEAEVEKSSKPTLAVEDHSGLQGRRGQEGKHTGYTSHSPGKDGSQPGSCNTENENE